MEQQPICLNFLQRKACTQRDYVTHPRSHSLFLTEWEWYLRTHLFHCTDLGQLLTCCVTFERSLSLCVSVFLPIKCWCYLLHFRWERVCGGTLKLYIKAICCNCGNYSLTLLGEAQRFQQERRSPGSWWAGLCLRAGRAALCRLVLWASWEVQANSAMFQSQDRLRPASSNPRFTLLSTGPSFLSARPQPKKAFPLNMLFSYCASYDFYCQKDGDCGIFILLLNGIQFKINAFSISPLRIMWAIILVHTID